MPIPTLMIHPTILRFKKQYGTDKSWRFTDLDQSRVGWFDTRDEVEERLLQHATEKNIYSLTDHSDKNNGGKTYYYFEGKCYSEKIKLLSAISQFLKTKEEDYLGFAFSLRDDESIANQAYFYLPNQEIFELTFATPNRLTTATEYAQALKESQILSTCLNYSLGFAAFSIMTGLYLRYIYPSVFDFSAFAIRSSNIPNYTSTTFTTATSFASKALVGATAFLANRNFKSSAFLLAGLSSFSPMSSARAEIQTEEIDSSEIVVSTTSTAVAGNFSIEVPPRVIGQINQLDFDINNMVLQGSYIYAGGIDNANRGKVLIANISNIKTPQLINTIDLGTNSALFAIHIVDNILYAAPYFYQQMYLWNISNPQNASLLDITIIPQNGRPLALTSYGKELFVSTDFGMSFCDISNLRQITCSAVINNIVIYDTVVWNDYIYSISYPPGIKIFNRSTKTLVNTISYPLCLTNPAQSDCVVGFHSIIVNFQTEIPCLIISGAQGIFILSLENLAQPVEISRISLQFSTFASQNLGNYLYPASSGEGLAVINILDPYAPTFLRAFRNSYSCNSVISVQENIVLGQSDALTILRPKNDYSNSKPSLYQTIQSKNSAVCNLAFINNVLAINTCRAIQLFELSEDKKATFLSEIITRGNIPFAAMIDGYLMTSSSPPTESTQEFYVYDILNPKQPTQLSKQAYPASYPHGIVTSSNYVFITSVASINGGDSYVGTLFGVLLSNLQQPIFFSYPPTASQSSALFPACGYHKGNTYMTSSKNLYIYNSLSNPPLAIFPLNFGDQPDVYKATSLVFHQNSAFISAGNMGIFQIDVTNPQQPRLINQYPIPQNTVNTLKVMDDFLFATTSTSDNQGCLYVYQVANNTLNPLNQYCQPGNFKDFVVDGNYVYAANTQNNTVAVIRLFNNPPYVQKALPNQKIKVAIKFNILIDVTVFYDKDVNEYQDGDYLTLSSSAPNCPSSNWICFDPTTQTLQGAPQLQHQGNHTVVITATDSSQASVSTNFTLIVEPSLVAQGFVSKRNYTEGVATPLPGMSVDALVSPQVSVVMRLSDPNAGQFNEGSSGTVVSQYQPKTGIWFTLIGSIDDINSLLANLVFSPSIQKNPQGKILSFYNKPVDVQVNIADGVNHPVQISFTLSPVFENHPPYVYTPGQFNNLQGKLGIPFNITIPILGNATLGQTPTFWDPDQQTLIYNVSPLPSWMTYDASRQKLFGIPTKDYFGLVDFTFSATDPYNETVALPFSINFQSSLSVPNWKTQDQYYEYSTYQFLTFEVNTPSSFLNVTCQLSDPNSGRLQSTFQSPLLPLFNATTGKWVVNGNSVDVNALLNKLDFLPTDNYFKTIAVTLTVDDALNPIYQNALTLFGNEQFRKPEKRHNLLDQTAFVGGDGYYICPNNTFIDSNDEPLIYQGLQYNGAALPPWIQFKNLTFSWLKPPNSMGEQSLQLALIAINLKGDQAQTGFTLRVIPSLSFTKPNLISYPEQDDNPKPVSFNSLIVNSLINATVKVELTVPAGFGTLNGSPSNILSFKGNVEKVNSLLANMTYLPSPYRYDPFSIDISVSDDINIPIQQRLSVEPIKITFPPYVRNPIPSVSASTRFFLLGDNPFEYKINDNVIVSRNGEPLIFTAQLKVNVNGQVNLKPLPSWLHFDSESRTFTGTLKPEYCLEFFRALINDLPCRSSMVITASNDKFSASTEFQLNISGTSGTSWTLGLLIFPLAVFLINRLFRIYCPYDIEVKDEAQKNKANIISAWSLDKEKNLPLYSFITKKFFGTPLAFYWLIYRSTTEENGNRNWAIYALSSQGIQMMSYSLQDWIDDYHQNHNHLLDPNNLDPNNLNPNLNDSDELKKLIKQNLGLEIELIRRLNEKIVYLQECFPQTLRDCSRPISNTFGKRHNFFRRENNQGETPLLEPVAQQAPPPKNRCLLQ
jgi:Mor family transcriptional regulator